MSATTVRKDCNKPDGKLNRNKKEIKAENRQ